jgi:hypothetical protein
VVQAAAINLSPTVNQKLSDLNRVGKMEWVTTITASFCNAQWISVQQTGDSHAIAQTGSNMYIQDSSVCEQKLDQRTVSFKNCAMEWAPWPHVPIASLIRIRPQFD